MFFRRNKKSRVEAHFPSFLIFTETMTKTSSEVQQQGDRIIKTTTTEGERLVQATVAVEPVKCRREKLIFSFSYQNKF